MPNIDVSSIEGFEAMTAEEKVEAMMKLEVPEKVDLAGYVKKDLYDRTASELSQAKKEAQSRMTEDERKKTEEANKIAEMEEKIQMLEQEKLESGYKARYLAMPGFSEELAAETAKALADGNMEKVFENQKKANDVYLRELEKEKTKSDPKPGGTGGTNEEEPESVAYARKRGRERAAALNASNDTLNKYKI